MAFDKRRERGRSAVPDTEPALCCAARRFMTSHRARLLCAARRLGQDDGAALASTLRDGVVDPRSRPEPWPIGALLEVLKRSAAGNDCQVPLTIQHLKELRDATAELSELRAEAEETKA